MKKPALDWTDRAVIIWWYNNLPKNRFLRWWKKPMIVSIYESMKARKEFAKEFMNTKLARLLKNININATKTH